MLKYILFAEVTHKGDIPKCGLLLKKQRRADIYHLRLKGDHYQMGVKRGTIFQKVRISFPLHLDDFQMKHGTKLK